MSEITFLCPQRISCVEIERDHLRVQMYLQDAFKAEIKKGNNRSKLILAPYIEKYVYFFLNSLLMFHVLNFSNPFALIKPNFRVFHMYTQQPLVSLGYWSSKRLFVGVWLSYSSSSRHENHRSGASHKNVSFIS